MSREYMKQKVNELKIVFSADQEDQMRKSSVIVQRRAG
jgi:hypothetical protein